MFDDYRLSPDAPVLVIGAAGLDMVGRMRTGISPGSSSPARIRASFGGVARNVAENLARLGHEVTLLTAVGEDVIGHQLLLYLGEIGVNTKAIIQSNARPTGSYLAVLDSKGELHHALDDMRILAAITPSYLQQHAYLFKEAAVIFVDSNLPKETLRTALHLARKERKPVCADPTSVSLAPKLRPFLNQIFLITPNSAEAGVLCERTFLPSQRKEALDTAKCLVTQGVDIAIVALAQFGLVYASSETSGYIDAIRTEIVDPTGAGDALMATLIFALLNDIPLDDAVRLGVSAATLTLRYPGTVDPELSLEKLYDQLVI